MNEIEKIETLKNQTEILSYNVELIKNDIKIAEKDNTQYPEEFINSKKRELINAEEMLFQTRLDLYNKLIKSGTKEEILEDLIICYAQRQISNGNKPDYYDSVLKGMGVNLNHIFK